MAKLKPRIGLALGSGGARGWAHIGVLSALAEHGVTPDLVAGCSIGAFVGAAIADGDLDQLADWVRVLDRQKLMSFLDVSFRGGLIKGDKLIQFFSQQFVDRDFAQLPVPFACVATDLVTGREVWLREGNVARAVRASIALPGLFTPVEYNGTWLVDGGLVNPVPVSLCRAMGADIVIAVDLSLDPANRIDRPGSPQSAGEGRPWWRLFSRNGAESASSAEGSSNPSLLEVVTSSINLMQVRIARSRLAGEPADVLISPRLNQMGLMDYYRADEAIEEGRRAVERSLAALRHAMDLPGMPS